MATVQKPMHEADFLTGGGEMGAVMRTHDWSTSPLGAPKAWPQSLRTVVDLMLTSKFPMFVAWGEELGFLYNDPYTDILGAKHPQALGAPFKDVWAEIWPDISPLIDAAMAGEATFRENLPLIMNRRGFDERTWFTFSYSPVRDEIGRVAGMFCACTETTPTVIAEQRLRESEARARGVLEGMAEGFVLLGRDFRVLDINGEGMRLEERGRDEIIGKTHWEAWPGTETSELGRLYKRAMADRVPLSLEHRYAWPDGRDVWLEVRAYPTDDGLALFYRDVTERRRAEEERLRLVAVIEQSPDFIGIADPGGRALYLNGGARRMCGLADNADIHDIEIVDFFPPEDHGFVWDVVLPAQAGERGYQGELRFRRFDGGEPVPVSYDGFAIRDDQGAITAFATVTRDITERVGAEAALRAAADTAARHAAEREAMLGQLAEGVIVTDRQGSITFVNDAAERLHGVKLLGVAPDDYTAVYYLLTEAGEPYPARELPLARAVLDGDTVEETRWRIRRADGTEVVAIGSARPIVGEHGDAIGAVLTVRDDTERTRAEAALRELNETLERRVAEELAERAKAEEALRQSQKMEAVGQLTGGIAHDFNNMLAVVIGSLDLLGRRIGVGDARAKRYVDAATDGARRAALLTQRLLAFSRQQPLKPEPIDVNKLVTGMSDLIRGSLGGDVHFETVLAGGGWRVHADPNQLENVLLNLAVNGRDAMAEGGRLTIETQNAHLDARYAAAHLGVPAGQYVLVAVTDTGSGMPAAVIAKAFDPFFTTKGVGKGTGLGLSQVYGFVKQSGGHVKIYSEPDQGTTVKVYLPRLIGSDQDIAEELAAGDMPLGDMGEVVLVVEDEPAVRQFSVDALGELGYRVIEADGAEAALRLLDAHPEITLMFTDVVMPDVNGAKLAEEARRRRPDLKVLFTTGYTRNAVVHNGVLDPGVELIGKPFTVEELAAKVRDVLDAPATEK